MLNQKEKKKKKVFVILRLSPMYSSIFYYRIEWCFSPMYYSIVKYNGEKNKVIANIN